jgi:hypothetical protein
MYEIDFLEACLEKLTHIEKQAREDPQVDPREVADASTLHLLYRQKRDYLEATRSLAGRKRNVEEVRNKTYGKTDEWLPRANWESDHEADIRAAEMEVRFDEYSIRTWNYEQAEWKRLYGETRTRILARPQSKLKMFLVEEEDAAPPAESETTPALKEWTGTDREFGDFVRKQFDEKKIPGADCELKALRIMCSRYVRSDGRPLIAENVQQNLRNRDRGK